MKADSPTYTLREVATATGWHLGTMRDYFVRGAFPWYDGDGKAVTAGATSKLSLRGAIRLGIAYQLWTLGVGPREAMKAATVFADFGNMATSNEARQNRQSGSLFPEGYETILLWRKAQGARVIPLSMGEGVGLSALFDHHQEPGPAVSIVHVDSVVASVMGKLAPNIK